MQIVISKYAADTSWADEYSDYTIIYNKGLNPAINEIVLDNVGREPHTFIYHIIENYENLSDYTVFLQDGPFDHDNIFKQRLDYYLESNERPDYVPFGTWEISTGFGSNCDQWHDPAHLEQAYYDIFGNKYRTTPFYFVAGGQFAVSKERILERPKSFYENILEHLKKSVDPNPYVPGSDTFPWSMERLWGVIFSDGGQ